MLMIASADVIEIYEVVREKWLFFFYTIATNKRVWLKCSLSAARFVLNSLFFATWLSTFGLDSYKPALIVGVQLQDVC